jgi:hypothetical protein
VNTGSTKCRQFIDQLSDYQLLKKASALIHLMMEITVGKDTGQLDMDSELK